MSFTLKSIEYQIPGRKVRQREQILVVVFVVCFFLSDETKNSLLEGAVIQDTASVGQHD